MLPDVSDLAQAVGSAPASTRAAVILSAAGVPPPEASPVADANVTRLPTAAKKRVQQPPHDVRRALAGHLEACPAGYHPPWVREALREVERLRGTAVEGLQHSAALTIAFAVIAHADPVYKAKVYGTVSHLRDLYHTAEMEKAVWLIEPLLNPFKVPPGAA